MPKQNDDESELAAMGSRVASARIYAGLVQKDLARLIDMDPQNLSKIERGVHATSSSVIRKLCAALCISADYLVSGIVDTSRSKFIDPNLLWEAGIQRFWRSLGGHEENAGFIRAVRDAAKNQRFESIEDLDEAVQRAWESALPSEAATLGPGGAAVGETPLTRQGAPSQAFIEEWNIEVAESLRLRPGPDWLEERLVASASRQGKWKQIANIKRAVNEARLEIEVNAQPPASSQPRAVEPAPKTPPSAPKTRTFARRKSEMKVRGPKK